MGTLTSLTTPGKALSIVVAVLPTIGSVEVKIRSVFTVSAAVPPFATIDQKN